MMKTAFVASLGFLGGALLVGGGGFWAMQQGLIPGLGVPLVQPSWPDVQPGGEATKGDSPQLLIADSAVLPVPKGVASAGFQAALETTVVSHNELAQIGVQLVATLQEINTRAQSQNFDGFFDLIFKAKTLVAQQDAGIATFVGGLAALEAELPTVTDVELRAGVTGMVAKGKVLAGALTRYSASVGVVISGKLPTQASIDAVYATALELRSASEAFNAEAEIAAVALKRALDAAPVLKAQTSATAR